MSPIDSTPPIVAVESLGKRFGTTRALVDVDLEIRRGEVHALAGENGAGKSTLVRILAGIHEPDHGRIRIDGQEVRIGSPAASLAHGLAFIHQDFDLAPNLTVAQNLLLNREPTRFMGLIHRSRERQLAGQYLDTIGLAMDPDRPLEDLSVAERQLVAIARSVKEDARLLIMDEPTSSLATDDIEQLLELAGRLCARGTAILFISHKLDEVFRISDRITVLRDGKVVGTRKSASSSSAEIVTMMVGRDLAAVSRKSVDAAGEPLLEVRDLASPAVFEPVSFDLSKGEVLGLYGLKGAGRMDVVRALFGLDPHSTGEVRVHGRRVRIDSPQAAIRHGLAYASRDRKKQGLFPNLNVRENLTLTALGRLSRSGFIWPRRERAACNRYLERLQVRTAGSEQPIGDLSGGNQQKVVLARWLLNRPQVLILDEPTAGIDIGARLEIYQLIQQLSADGIGVLLVTSELPELLALSDRVLVMHEGAMVGAFDRHAATEEAIMHAIYRSTSPPAKGAPGAIRPATVAE
jgi:rhamnose transport system ATP-binding protein